MPTKYSFCSYFPWNIQGKYRDSLCGEFIRQILPSSKGTRFRDPGDAFQANVTVKTHFTVCVNEHKHFYKSHKQFTQLFSIERLFFILHHFAKPLWWGKAPMTSAESPPLGLRWKINPRQLIAPPCRWNWETVRNSPKLERCHGHPGDLAWMMYGDICTQYPHSFLTSWWGLSCLTISHTPHRAQINGRTWRSISSSPKRSCLCLTKTQLHVFNIPPLPPPATAAAAWLDHGNGLFALKATSSSRSSVYSQRRAWTGGWVSAVE